MDGILVDLVSPGRSSTFSTATVLVDSGDVRLYDCPKVKTNRHITEICALVANKVSNVFYIDTFECKW